MVFLFIVIVHFYLFWTNNHFVRRDGENEQKKEYKKRAVFPSQCENQMQKRCFSLLYLKIIFRSFGLFFDMFARVPRIAFRLTVIISTMSNEAAVKQPTKICNILKEPQKESNNSNNNKKDGLIKICVNFINKS